MLQTIKCTSVDGLDVPVWQDVVVYSSQSGLKKLYAFVIFLFSSCDSIANMAQASERLFRNPDSAKDFWSGVLSGMVC